MRLASACWSGQKLLQNNWKLTGPLQPPAPEPPQSYRTAEYKPNKRAPAQRASLLRPPPRPNRYYGTVALDATRVGRDAGEIAKEVIAHLSDLLGAQVTVTLEIAASVPDGFSGEEFTNR